MGGSAVTVSLAEPGKFYTQRNNRIDPAETCGVTSMVNALAASGIPFSAPEGVQPEDHLAAILDTPEAKARLASSYPYFAERKPREVHAMLSWAVNERFVGRRVTMFSTTVDFAEILFRIVRHRAASVLSGSFTPYGHIVTVVGFETDQGDVEAAQAPSQVDRLAVKAVLVNDSWGDWHWNYAPGVSGYSVRFTVPEFLGLTKPFGSWRKWAHLFDRDGRFEE